MPVLFRALDAAAVRALRAGAPDAYGMMPERRRAEAPGHPCRHCLRDVPAGNDYLTLAWRPFPSPQPYAETGPIFLCADCTRAADSSAMPAMLAAPDYILRGYGADHRIVYGTGGVVATGAIAARAQALFADPGVAYVHVRSARNNCYQVRIERG